MGQDLDYTSLDAVASMLDALEDPRGLRSTASELTRLASLASAKSVRLAELAGVCFNCFKPKNAKGRCSDNHCTGWLP